MSQPPSRGGGLVGQRLGKYELVALLALGGTAEIYLARIGGVAGFEKYVVVKCLHDHLADDSEFVRMFLDEARLGAQLTHSNIVQTLELGEQQGRYYMVMEYLAGMSLAVIARKAAEHLPGGRLPVDLLLGLMAQACAGLHYAHNRTDSSGQPLHIVHRDVSPQNLVITFEGILKVVDFGIAKAAVRETQTQSGTIKGKFAYMSPEQCMGGAIDCRTDVFALGIILHEFLTGKRLFRRETAYDTYHAILECKVLPPSQLDKALDPRLDDIILRALKYEAKDRYQSAEELGEALMGFLHSRGKSVGTSEIGQFFDRHFASEIADHGQRMRALISGRQTSTMDEYWEDLDDSASAAKRKSQPRAQALGSGSSTVDIEPGALMREPGALMREEPSLLNTLDTEPLQEDAGEDDGDGATRIEYNPLQRIQKRHEEESGRLSRPGPSSAPGAGTPKRASEPGVRSALTDMPSPAEAVARKSKPSIPMPGATATPSPLQASQRVDAGARTMVPGALTGSSAAGSATAAPVQSLGQGKKKYGPEAMMDTHPVKAITRERNDQEADDEAATLISERTPEVDAMLAAARAGVQQQSGTMEPDTAAGAWQSPGQAPGNPYAQQPASWPGMPGNTPGPGGDAGVFQQQGGYYGQASGVAYPVASQGMGTNDYSAQLPRLKQDLPVWLLALIFMVCVGVGLGAILLVSRLF